MFSFKKNRLDPNLKHSLKNEYYKKYRVLIICSSLQKDIEKKIKFYRGKILYSIPLCNCICASLSSRSIERLLENPQVSYITQDSYAHICGYNVLTSNKVLLSENYSLSGKNITVGIVDTGVYPHTDLLSPNHRIKYFLDLINDFKYPYDDNGHGTFISGIIASNGALSKGIYKGIAFNSNICMVKAFNKLGKSYVSQVLYAIECLINLKEENDIKIICLPFEVSTCDHLILNLFDSLFKIAKDNNIITVVPAGTCDAISGIATSENCITVGGIDTTKTPYIPYEFSSSGPFGKLTKPDLCAAAVNICSLGSNTSYISQRMDKKIYPKPLDTPYVSYSGTSCAAAYVSGICALLFENNPDLKFNDILSLIKVSCNLLDIPKNFQGAGTIDLNKLLP